MKLNTNYTFYSIVICTIVFDLRLLANGRDNSQRFHLAKGLSDFKLGATTPNYKQQHATDATCSIQQCWELLAKNVASVCTGLNFYRNISNREPLFDNFHNNEKNTLHINNVDPYIYRL